MKRILMTLTGLGLMTLPSCVHVDPVQVEVKPIHITMDVNVTVKVDRQLDDFFAFQDKYQRQAPPSSQPAPNGPGSTN